MQFLLYLFIFLFGLAAGSFLNVLILRLGSGQVIRVGGEEKKGIGGRSMCPKCRHQLAWHDLMPVLSFLLLGAKCRYCKERISWQYPIVELATGIIFVLLLANFWHLPARLASEFVAGGGFGVLDLVFWIFIASCLIVIFVSDLRFFIIPDEIILAGIAGFLIFRILDLGFVSDFGFQISDLKTLLGPLLSAIAASVFFLAIVLVTRGKGMGLGDVKMAFLMGLVLGWPLILPALLLAFVAGALIGLGLIAVGRAKMKSEVPFGTFLAASTFLAIVFGQAMISKYLELLF